MTTDPAQKTPGARPLRYELRNRYIFKGTLEMTTGLHVGGGKATLSHTDSPVVLTPEGLPFIPGSSLKGVLRSTIEKFVASLPADLGLRSCGLPTEKDDDTLDDNYTGKDCPTAHQKWIARERREDPQRAQDIIELARENLCHTCQLFGSPFAAGRIRINDLYLDAWSGATQIRDGVAIDRDKETARPGAKYDFEVVPSTSAFSMYMLVENATAQDLQLLSIGLSEFTSGFSGIGGLRSRGLGACILKDLEIRALELAKLDEAARKQRLLRYLLRKKDGTEDGLDPIDAQTFFNEHITALFQETPANS
ncbi:MAG: CRISPR-associated RAMP protein Csx7 [Chloroflexota bacterium]|nr:CRISPR-associated RAMP protein Csx7 [Chloroflexota bacterium]